MAVENQEKGGSPGRPAPAKKKSVLMPILLALSAIVVGLVIVIAMQPADFRVERSAKIPAPPAEVFAQVNDFHAWKEWSPWAKLDPQSKETYEGPAAGTGAIFKWSGNNEVGEGMMTLTDSQPNDLIRIKLEFIRPFADTSTTEFTFKPEGDQTLVTWSMFGQHTFMSKAMCLVVSMDKMVGGSFEQGLAQMKSVVEAAHPR